MKHDLRCRRVLVLAISSYTLKFCISRRFAYQQDNNVEDDAKRCEDNVAEAVAPQFPDQRYPVFVVILRGIFFEEGSSGNLGGRREFWFCGIPLGHSTGNDRLRPRTQLTWEIESARAHSLLMKKARDSAFSQHPRHQLSNCHLCLHLFLKPRLAKRSSFRRAGLTSI